MQSEVTTAPLMRLGRIARPARASAAIALLVFCAACSERRDVSYPSRADAVAAGEMRRGWLPEWIPQRARNIRLAYDVSSPETWCAFEVSREDASTLGEHLTRADEPPQGVRTVRDPHLPWWPEFLSGELDTRRIRSQGFAILTASEPDVGARTRPVLCVLNAKTGAVFMYRRAP